MNSAENHSETRERSCCVHLDDWNHPLSDEIRSYLSEQVDGPLDETLKAWKVPPASTFVRVNFLKIATRDAACEQLQQGYSAWLRERRLDHYDVNIIPHPVLDDVIEIKVEAIDSARSPNSDYCSLKRVFCDRFCGEAVLRGADVFVPGILAADKSIHAGDEVAIYAHVGGPLPTRGSATEAGTNVWVGIGIAVHSRSDLFRLQEGVGVRLLPGRGPGAPLVPLSGIIPDESIVFAQNLPSMLVAHALDVQSGHFVLDMCAAPCGKSLHVASRCPDCTVVACDQSKKKIEQAKNVIAACGASFIVTPVVLNTTKCVIRDKTGCKRSIYEILDQSTKSSTSVRGFRPESFDRILLDPPCSALGLRPKLHISQSSSRELIKFAEYQGKFVREAVALLKPGGILTYSTCTFHVEENENMVAHMLDTYACLELLPIHIPVGQYGHVNSMLAPEACFMVRRFSPTDEIDTMGFFVAKFRKKCL